MSCIAGIGARKTPKFILDIMVWIGQWCLLNGIYVRSGHADGADYAFERGANSNTIVYLPWRSFNSQLVRYTTTSISWDDVMPSVRSQAIQSVEAYHPAPGRLSQGAMKCMARNYFQMRGTKKDPVWVDCVVCWTPDAKGGGGTGQALRIAHAHDIPVLDLGIYNDLDPLFSTTKEYIIKWLEEATGHVDTKLPAVRS